MKAMKRGSKAWRLVQAVGFASMGVMGIAVGIAPERPFSIFRVIGLLAGAACLFVAMKAFQAAKRGD